MHWLSNEKHLVRQSSTDLGFNNKLGLILPAIPGRVHWGGGVGEGAKLFWIEVIIEISGREGKHRASRSLLFPLSVVSLG